MNFLSQITGSFAQPCAENPTVAMIEAAYQHHQLDWRYLNCEVTPENLKDAVNGAKAMGWAGFNCSLPHKVAVIEQLDSLGESASIIGAVNCVVIRDGKLIGENTDGKGFLQSLREQVDPVGKSIVLFGAGGAARAIGVETALAGAKQITVVNRTLKRGQELVDLLNQKTPSTVSFESWDGEFKIPAGTDIVINGTSIGLFPDVNVKPAIDLNTLTSEMIVADVIPNPPKTGFIREATERGCKTIDGLGMLVNQGVIGIKFWTGMDVDSHVMRAKLEELFNN